jgi:DNA repair protein SbcC/Rad50
VFEKLTLRNFQSHQSRTIEFESAVTVFIGPTDAGKSAIIRALRWVCLNRAPKNHIRFGAKSAKAILYVDGHSIIRAQGNQNYYSLDGEILRAFSRSVPNEVAKILNIDSDNFQRQHDPLFWISLPAPQVTKELNQIVDLSIIDKTLTKAQAKVRKHKSEVEISRERLALAKQQVAELSWIEDAAAAFERVEAAAKTLNDAKHRHFRAVSLGRDVSEVVTAQGNIDRKIEFAENIVAAAKKADELSKELERRESQLQQIGELEDKVCLMNDRIKKMERLLAKVKSCPVCKQPIEKSSA